MIGAAGSTSAAARVRDAAPFARMRAMASAALIVLLTLGLCACDRVEDAHSGQRYVIAGGGTSGVYYGYGSHLAAVLTRTMDAEFSVAETDGSVDNLLRIGSGEALIGFAQSDAAAEAIEGVGPFDEPQPIQAIARLYDEYVHVVVRADSDLTELDQLPGRTVSLGAPISGVNLVATRVLGAAGIDPASIENPALGPDASIEALKEQEIDAFFWVGGVPTPGLEKLAAETPIRLLEVPPQTVEVLNSTYGGVYRISEFPLGSYGWETPTMTMAVPNYLIVAESAPEGLVRSIVQQLFEARAQIARQVPPAALLDRRQAIFTDPIPLHPGAAEYYVEAKD